MSNFLTMALVLDSPRLARARLLLGAVVVTALTATLPPLVAPAQAEPAPATKEGTTTRPLVTGWLPYWKATESVDGVLANRDLFDEVSPFWVTSTSTTGFDVKGSVTELKTAVSRLRSAGVEVVLTVNSALNADQFAALVADPDRRSQHARALAKLAREYRADGIDLDYESINFSGSSASKDTIRRLFPKLVAAANARLDRTGRVLVVTMPPRRSDSDPNWWTYDYGTLGARADRVRLMTYDYSWRGGKAGPLAPKAWVREVLDHATARIDPLKISFGLPAYGYDWYAGVVSGTCPSKAREAFSRTTSDMESFAQQRGITPTWSASGTGRTFTYRQTYSSGGSTCTVQREAWYEDARSIRAKLPLVGEYRLRGVAVWAFGGLGAGSWQRFRDYGQAHPVTVPAVTISAPQSLAYGTTERVRGRVTAATQPLASVPVHLERRSPSSGAWRRVDLARTGAEGRVRFDVAPKRHAQWRLVVDETWSRQSATSRRPVTRVQYALRLGSTSARLSDGATAVIDGRVAPARAGTLVQRQERVDGQWVVRATKELSSDGRFRFAFRPKGSGDHVYRVVVPTALLDRAVSPRYVVTVR